MMWKKINIAKKFILNLFFPKFCFSCKREGIFLCQDCQSLLEILETHQKYVGQNLKELYWALPYQNPLAALLVRQFKYDPFVRELAEDLASLILIHFQLLEEPADFSDFLIMPTPLTKKRTRWRGFNQAEEIGKELSRAWQIPLVSNCLIKIKETAPQVELSEEKRKENIKNVFLVKNPDLIKNQKILLVDDVFTTGSTMEECAKVLNQAGAKEIIGLVIARG